METLARIIYSKPDSAPKDTTNDHQNNSNANIVSRMCANCGQQGSSSPARSSPLRCGRCRSVWYCNRECQLADWKAGHRSVCSPKPHQQHPSEAPAKPETETAVLDQLS